MKYELAKELKDAGFPQFVGSRSVGLDSEGMTVPYMREQPQGIVYLPSLSVLIEACGDSFTSLEKRPDGWRAIHHDNPEDFHSDALIPFLTTVGSTPEEAVAKLWLALNKKP